MALPFVACNKEELTEPVSKGEQISISVKATAEDLANLTDTKTYIDGMNVLWSANEQMSIFLINGNTAASATSTGFTGEGEAEAMFAFNFNSEDIPASGPYTYGGIYPASADKGLTKGQTTDKVELPATQNATATSYDPAAYIMVAKPESFETVQTDWIASYRRATALNKITLTGISEDIASVAITVPEGKYLAGRRYIDVATGESGEIYFGETNTVMVNYATALPRTAADVWFTSWGVEVAEGEAVTVKVTTVTNKAYTKTFNARAEGIKFTENYLNTLAVDMSDAIAEETGLPLPFTEDFSEVEKGSISTSNDKLASLSAFDISGDVYQAGGAIRLGSGSAVGTITTKSALDLSEPFTIIVFGTGWDDNEHVLNITAGSQVKSITFTTDKNGGAYEPQYVYFNAETNMTKVSFSNKTGERVLLDNIEIVSGEWIPTPELTSVETVKAVANETSAVLSGSYDALFIGESDVLKYGFEWGVDDGSDMASVEASNAEEGDFSYEIDNLVSGTTYVFRAWAQINSNEKVYGDLLTFTASEPVGIEPSFDITSYNAIPEGWEGTIGFGSYFKMAAGNYLTSPMFNMEGYTSARISIDLASFGGTKQQSAVINISYDGGKTYPESYELPAPTNTTYKTQTYDIKGPFTTAVVINLTPNDKCTSSVCVRIKNYSLSATK